MKYKCFNCEKDAIYREYSPDGAYSYFCSFECRNKFHEELHKKGLAYRCLEGMTNLKTKEYELDKGDKMRVEIDCFITEQDEVKVRWNGEAEYFTVHIKENRNAMALYLYFNDEKSIRAFTKSLILGVKEEIKRKNIAQEVKQDEYDAVAEMESEDRYGEDMKRFEELQREER